MYKLKYFLNIYSVYLYIRNKHTVYTYIYNINKNFYLDAIDHD